MVQESLCTCKCQSTSLLVCKQDLKTTSTIADLCTLSARSSSAHTLIRKHVAHNQRLVKGLCSTLVQVLPHTLAIPGSRQGCCVHTDCCQQGEGRYCSGHRHVRTASKLSRRLESNGPFGWCLHRIGLSGRNWDRHWPRLSCISAHHMHLSMNT